MRHATMLLATLAFTPLYSAAAQVQQPPVELGARVRVTILRPCPDYTSCSRGRSRHTVGTFLAWKADSLVMESNGNTLAVPQDFVTKLELSTGRGSTTEHTRAGAIGGFFVGSAIGIAIAAVTAPEEGCGGFGPPGTEKKSLCLLYGWILGSAGGVLVGGVIGSVIPGDRWVNVPLNRLGVNLGPQRDGRFGFGASVRF